MHTAQRTPYPPPPEYAQKLPAMQPGGMVNPSPYPQPMAHPSPQSATIPGMIPLQQYPQNCPVQGTTIINNVQPTVVTTQSTVIASQTPHCRDYLPWSIVNLIFCCFIFGIVALIYSIKTRSAIKQRNWELAMKRSRMSLRFNVSAFILACCFAVIAAVYRLCFYSSSSYNGYSSSSYNGYSSSFYHG